MDRPNIVYIHSHDTGRLIRPYGYDVPTPNLQRLAAGGVLLRRCFCAAPTCSPSRAALLTGQSPHGAGMLGLANRGCSLGRPDHHIVATLKRAGYFAALSGIQHLVPDADRSVLGYDAVLAGRGDPPERAAVEFLDAAPDQPFFLSVGFVETHRPFPPADADIDPARCPAPETVPETPATREDMARYMTMARRLDRKMGDVFAALDRNGLAANTLVICTTDHGASFPRMKGFLTDGGIGVMLILRGPGPFAGGKVVDGLASQIDLFPTICDVADIDPPDWLEGVSLLPLVTGAASAVRDEVFAEVTYHAAYEPMRCVRTDRHKYIRRYDGRTRPVLCNMDASPSKDAWLAAGCADIDPEAEALYDLVLDPRELNNLLARSDAQPTLADMRARLDAWMRRTDDPLLAGQVPPVAGAILNDPDAVEWTEPTRVAQ